MTGAAPASPVSTDEDALGPRHTSLPAEPVLDDEQCGFIASSSLVFVMSGAPDAAPDVSPRGDLPGFVKIVDRRYLLMPDRVGNNRVDTIRNVVQDPRVALVFMKARDERVLVVDGTAVNRTEAGLLAAHKANGRTPRSVMEITVANAVLGPSHALALSGIWSHEAGDPGFTFSLGAALAGQMGNPADAAATEELVENDYRSKLY